MINSLKSPFLPQKGRIWCAEEEMGINSFLEETMEMISSGRIGSHFF
jgi:hypothetical protein